MLVSRAKEAVSDPSVVDELIQVAKYRCLSKNVVKAENPQYTMREAAADIAEMDFQDDPCRIKGYIQMRLSKNDFTAILEHERQDIPPSIYASLQSCQPTSCSVERSFSILKRVLRKDRNFNPQNIRHYVILANNRFI